MNSDQAANKHGLLFGDLRLLILLFVSLRLVLLMAYQPILVDGIESGIGVGGDRLFHYRLATLVDEGMLPFRDWWSEFPPIWYGIISAIYSLLGDGANFTNWSFLLGMLMLACELGNLLLVRAIGHEIYGEPIGMQLAWVYSIAAAPIVFMWWNFESMMTFTILLGIYLWLRKQSTFSAFVIGFGILVKFVPALLFGAVIRFQGWAQSAKVIGLAAGIAALAYLPLLISNGEFTLISLRAQLEKPSSQTIWALIDGNFSTGNIANAESRLSPDHAYAQADKNPGRIPNWLRLALAAGLGLVIYRRTRRRDERGMVAFVSVTILVFYLQAQAWSPQWTVLVITMSLLVFPTHRGVLVTVVLTLLTLAEYPVLWSRTGDLVPAGVMAGDLVLPWAALVLMRTGLLAGLALACYMVLRENVSAKVESA